MSGAGSGAGLRAGAIDRRDRANRHAVACALCHNARMSDAPETAILVVNLGTPEAPTAPAVARYLAEFLGDKRVVAIPRLFWWPLLHWVILPRRSPKSAEKYAQVWLADGSPLAVYTRRLAEGMQRELPGHRVAWAMRYGAPALAPGPGCAARGGRCAGSWCCRCTRSIRPPPPPRSRTWWAPGRRAIRSCRCA